MVVTELVVVVVVEEIIIVVEVVVVVISDCSTSNRSGKSHRSVLNSFGQSYRGQPLTPQPAGQSYRGQPQLI